MKLYNELSQWWPLMSPAREDQEEANFYRTTLQSAAAQPIATLLELGSGGGNNASHMKQHYREMVLVDMSSGMLAMSRALNPELAHYRGRHADGAARQAVRRGFRARCHLLHDDRVGSSEGHRNCLRRTASPAAWRCSAPTTSRRTSRAGTDHGGEDAGTRGMRWLEWQWDPDPGRLHVSRGLCLSAARVRRLDARRARSPRRRTLSARHLAAVASTKSGSRIRSLPFEHADLEPWQTRGRSSASIPLTPWRLCR